MESLSTKQKKCDILYVRMGYILLLTGGEIMIRYEEDKVKQMIAILGIENEEDNIQILNEWIEESGFDEVYRKIIRIQKRSDDA